MADGLRYVETSRDGVYARLRPWPADVIWLRSSWGLDGQGSLSFSADGKRFEPAGEALPLAWGSYRGSRIGLFTFNPAGEAGHVDIDRVDYPVSLRAAR